MTSGRSQGAGQAAGNSGARTLDLMTGAVRVLPDDPSHVARFKKRVLRSSRPTRPRDLEAIWRLAYVLFIWQPTTMLDDVLKRLELVTFTGDFNLWTWVQGCQALYAYVRHERGDRAAVKAVRAEIRTAGFVERRRKGLLLLGPTGHRQEYRAARAKDDRRSMLGWGIPYASELVYIWVMGGSLRLPRRKVRSELDRVVAELRERPPAR